MGENLNHYDTNNAVLSVDGIMEQVNMIQHMMSRAMKKDEHYGIIPGTSGKPSLLKPGAEKLAMMFRLAPSYAITKTDMGRGHVEYSVVCSLTHINNGAVWGQGVGSCSTSESKFKFRWDKTGKPVPSEYWNSKDKSLLGGEQFTARKSGGSWEIYQRVEHDNPADYYNTCLKMAKKRAMVDAILTATAASDIFTQDIEDMVENGIIDAAPASPKANVTPPPTRQQEPRHEKKSEVTIPPTRLPQDDYNSMTNAEQEDIKNDNDDVFTQLENKVREYCVGNEKNITDVYKTITEFTGSDGKKRSAWSLDQLRGWKNAEKAAGAAMRRFDERVAMGTKFRFED
ncbi:MAG: hypothetical protein PHC68_16120 [Syntrophorhabdaceae bacterium]|nr:hypothetical protein [Syntrophorhabdaceae bacterium]